MSKYVKNLVANHLRERLDNVNDALLVDMIGLSANKNNRLRALLRDKNIHVMVVKNSLAARATEGSPLSALFTGLEGTAAVCWGAEDIVSLAKEIAKLAKDDEYAPFKARGGIMDEKAAIELLHGSKIGGVGLDVYENEPDIDDEWRGAPRTVLLPHLGSATRETREEMSRLLCDGIRNVLKSSGT